MLKYCLTNNGFYYLSLIFKQYDKNKKLIKKLITNYDNSNKILLDYLKYLNDENSNDYKFINDYFGICKKLKYCFEESIFNDAIGLCKNNNNLSKCESIIQENYEKLRLYQKYQQ